MGFFGGKLLMLQWSNALPRLDQAPGEVDKGREGFVVRGKI
jgi:hypothetical protein